MKAKNLLVVLLITILFSCKNEKKENEITKSNEAPKVENEFTVTFNLVAKKDDNFHLFYTEDNTINFSEEKSIWLPFKGSEVQQEIKFVLPEDIIPTNLRVDFGLTKDQSDIELKTFHMSYFGKSFNSKGSEIFKYFYPNKDNTILDNTTSTLKRAKPNQDSGPSIYPHISLVDEISKLVK